jgi:hypothetical protein
MEVDDKEMYDFGKSIIKPALYSVCFGGGVRRLNEHFGSDITELAPVDTELKEIVNPEELEQYDRENVSQCISEFEAWKYTPFTSPEAATERIKDAFGYVHRTRRGLSYLTLIAMVAQSAELKLLEPAINLACEVEAEARDKGRQAPFKILLYQFDGFTVHFTDKRLNVVERWAKRICDAVEVRAEEMNVVTRLEYEKL